MSKAIKDQTYPFTIGSSLIDDERMRQCEKGWSSKHDDGHADGSMLRAAMDILTQLSADENGGEVPDAPTWVQELQEHVADKYKRAPIRRLVIAGAMIVAEIERRERIMLSPKRRAKKASAK